MHIGPATAYGNVHTSGPLNTLASDPVGKCELLYLRIDSEIIQIAVFDDVV